MKIVAYDSPEQLILKHCPFDGEEINCFEIPDHRYVKNGSCWVIECKNMGCILPRCGFYVRLEDLIEIWNKRD